MGNIVGKGTVEPDLRGIFQPQSFYGSMIPRTADLAQRFCERYCKIAKEIWKTILTYKWKIHFIQRVNLLNAEWVAG